MEIFLRDHSDHTYLALAEVLQYLIPGWHFLTLEDIEGQCRLKIPGRHNLDYSVLRGSFTVQFFKVKNRFLEFLLTRVVDLHLLNLV